MWKKRKKIWINRFQTQLGLRLIVLFASYQIAVWLMVIVGRHLLSNLASFLGVGATTWWLVSLLGAVLALCFLFLYDTVKFTHRLVGPLYRFQKVIQAITAGEELTRVQLRQGDFLQELKDELNEMIEALEQRGAVVIKKAEAAQAATPCK
jgi:methyl-accepting chemotaxis protein